MHAFPGWNGGAVDAVRTSPTGHVERVAGEGGPQRRTDALHCTGARTCSEAGRQLPPEACDGPTRTRVASLSMLAHVGATNQPFADWQDVSSNSPTTGAEHATPDGDAHEHAHAAAAATGMSKPSKTASG
jgi:hypothetical protein